MSDIIVMFAQRNLGIGCVVKEFAKEAIEKGELFELEFVHQLPIRHFV